MLATAETHKEYLSYILDKAVSTSKWSDKDASALLTIIAEIMADIGVSNNSAIMIAAREAFINIARRRSSIFAGARWLGVQIRGKEPATTTVLFTNNSGNQVSYAKYTPVTVGGQSGFLTQTLTLASGASDTATVELGTVKEETLYLAEDIELRTFTIDAADFVVSDFDVWTTDAYGNEYSYTKYDEALISADVGDRVVCHTFNDAGNCVLRFGGSYFGYAPPKGHTLHVRYRSCTGSAGNSDSIGLSAEITANTSVAGKTQEVLAGGDDELSPDYYRAFGPILNMSRNTLSRPDEWRAAVLAQSGVADCAILSQRDVAPNDPTWQNQLRICVLPKSGSSFGGVNPNPTSAAWERLRDTLNKYKPLHEIQTWNPTRLLVNCYVEIAVFDWYSGDLRDVEQAAESALTALMSPKIGTLGRTLELTDLTNAIAYDSDTKERRSYIDYVRILSPTEAITPGSKLEYVAFRSLRVIASYSSRSNSDDSII